MSDKTTFEDALKNLEKTVEQLEQGQLPLDEALDCFEVGVKNANLCRKKLQAVEERVELLMKKADGTFRVEPFAQESDQE